MRNVLPFVIILAALILAMPARAAVSVSAALERQTIMAGETASLQITVEGGTPQSAENFPPLPGLSIRYQGNQQQFTSINGRSSFRHVLTYAITASQPGQYQLPAIRITVDGAAYATQPLALTVTKREIPSENRPAFVRLLAPRSELYVGELMPIEAQLYVTDADNLQAPQIKSESFIVHKQAQHTRSRTQMGQTIYNVISFKMSVSAVKAGKLTLGPAEMTFVLNVRLERNPNDVFGIFGRVQRRQVTVASPAVEINVLPLPANAPPEFTGAIGSFDWKVEANPKEVTAGDPITLRAVVSGTGNLDNLKFPEVNWADFKLYPASSTMESADPLGLEGSKTFEQVVIPQNASVREIPALAIAYFDPAQKAYVKLAQPAIGIAVKPSSAAAAVPTVARTENQPDEEPAERTDIVHIKMRAGPLATVAPPLIRQPWFLAFQALPLLAYAGLTIWRKRRDHLANNPRLRRKLRTQKTVASGLADLRQLAAANNAADFHALVFRLLQEQLGERLDLPASAITEAVIDERLPQRGAPPTLLNQLHALFRLCNQARYAPVQTNAELLAIARDLENALNELQHLPE
jgi:hypothetical protein